MPNPRKSAIARLPFTDCKNIHIPNPLNNLAGIRAHPPIRFHPLGCKLQSGTHPRKAATTDMALTIENLEEARARKAEQARINGRLSKGPTSEEGKRQSSQNSIRHGLTANEHTLLFGEIPEEYDEVYNAWVDKLRPADKAEMRLVEKYANIDWRLERLAMMETCILNLSTAKEFDRIKGEFQRIDAIGHLVEAWRTNSSVSQCLDRVYRYTATLQRQSSAILRDFRDFEKRRLARELRGWKTGPP